MSESFLELEEPERLERRVMLTGNVIRDASFEDVDVAEQWFGFGGEVAHSTVEVAPSGGAQSAFVSNRLFEWAGIGQELTDSSITRDADYAVSAWVRLAPDSEGQATSDELRLEMRIDDDLASGDLGARYVTIAQATVSSDEWTLLAGGFRLNYSGSLTNVEFRVNGAAAGVAFYVDAVEMTEVDWRTAAEAAIVEHRQRDVSLLVLNELGDAEQVTSIDVVQVGHEFGFGTAVHSGQLDNADYTQFVADNFNWVTPENALKWQNTEIIRGVEDYDHPVIPADRFVEFALANDLQIHGHTILWGDPDFGIPQWLVDDQGDVTLTAAELQAEIQERLVNLLQHEIVGSDGQLLMDETGTVLTYGDVIDHWDVNNEMLVNSFFADQLAALAPNFRADFFGQVAALVPEASLFTNEFNIVTGAHRADDYVDLVEGLLADGASIDALGVQGHYFQRGISSVGLEHDLQVLSAAGLPIWITEFDHVNPDVTERAKDLEVFYRTAFANENVEGIVMWGFWEGAADETNSLSQFERGGLNAGPDAALVNTDWTVNEAGLMYQALRAEWTTEVSTDGPATELTFRGYHGEYKVSITTTDGRVLTQTFVLDSTSDSELQLAMLVPNVAPEVVLNQAGLELEEGMSGSVFFTVSDVGSEGLAGVSAVDPNGDQVGTIRYLGSDWSGLGDYAWTFVATSEAFDAKTIQLIATDRIGDSAMAQFELSVRELPPVVTSDDLGDVFETVPVESVSTTNLLANDLDPGGDVLTIVAVDGSAANVGNTVVIGGVAEVFVNEDGSWSVTPDADLSVGTYDLSFSYTAIDGDGLTQQAQVTLQIIGENRAPTVSIQAASSMLVGSSLPISLMSSDGDRDDSLTTRLELIDGQGDVVASSASGSLVFAPTVAGDYLVRATVDDGTTDTVVEQSLEVLPIPILESAVVELRLSEGEMGAVDFAVLAAGTGLMTLEATDPTGAEIGLITGIEVDPAGEGSYRWSITDTSDALVTTVTIRLVDTNGEESIFNISLTVVELPPTTVADDLGVILESSPSSSLPTTNLLFNDFDPGGDPLTIVELNGSAANVGTSIDLDGIASLTVNEDGSWSVAPANDLSVGEYDVSFSYTVSDEDGMRAEELVTFQIVGENAAPAVVLVGVAQAVAGQSIRWSANVDDADRDDEVAVQLEVLLDGQVIESTMAQSIEFSPALLGEYVVRATVDDGLATTVVEDAVSVQQWLMADGELFVAGTQEDDRILILAGKARDPDGSLRVKLNGEELGLFQPLTSVTVFGLDGDDLIRMSSLRRVTQRALFFGNEGDDRLFGGRQADALDGGAGRDRLVGGFGDDALIGGRLLLGSDDGSVDRLIGRSGADLFVFGVDDVLVGFDEDEDTAQSDGGLRFEV